MTATDLPEIGLGCGNLLRATLPELIDTAGRHGFGRITARAYTYAAAIQEGWTEASLRRELAAAGVEVTALEALTHALPGTGSADSLDPARRALMPPDVLHPPDEETVLRAAEALGAPTVNVTHFLGAPTPTDQLAEAVAAVCRRAGARGLSIALEFVPGTGLPDLLFTQGVVEACGEPNSAIVLDVFHLARSGGTVDDIPRLPPGAIACVQLSDCTPLTAGQDQLPFQGRSLPGEGTLPLHDLVRAAFENSPTATLDIEVLNTELSGLPIDDAAARLAAGARSWLATW